MTDETLTLVLAGKEYTIHKLTLRQARNLRVGAGNYKEVEPEDWAASVVALAMERDHKEMTAEAILDLQVTAQEIGEACSAVMRFAGFNKKDDAPGEAQPGTA